MRKISLSIEDLAVESFDTTKARATKIGTVHGHDDDSGENSEYSNCATCLEGCPRDTMTCFGSCRNSQYYPGGPCQPYIDANC
ncbi:MAG TPA: hypothetical protein VGC13_02435 [Longimicrobium sp.]|jgi:hypothetical protein|uniref:hypothetical protein n=1 Tax=Longimicrobium sp. TaxID=2029185 RepID=UPI002ED7FB1A